MSKKPEIILGTFKGQGPTSPTPEAWVSMYIEAPLLARVIISVGYIHEVKRYGWKNHDGTWQTQKWGCDGSDFILKLNRCKRANKLVNLTLHDNEDLRCVEMEILGGGEGITAAKLFF
jgi:hypothetical protein